MTAGKPSRGSKTMDMGLLPFPSPTGSAAMARNAEQMEFSSVVYADTQCLTPEVWSPLMLVAAATERIEIGTGVTNPVTRDPSVTASAALVQQVASGGRVVLGIGRGDSSLAKIGRRPAPPANFELYLARLRAYMDGEEIGREGSPSPIEWLDDCEVPRVPIAVAATGPKVIDIAARRADRICFAVGADTGRLGACIARARNAAEAAGRDPDSLRFGAFVSCVVHAGIDFVRVVPGSRDMPRDIAAGSIRALGKVGDGVRERLVSGIRRPRLTRSAAGRVEPGSAKGVPRTRRCHASVRLR